MTDSTEQEDDAPERASSLYSQRGFYGSAEVADTAKAALESDPRVLGILPARGLPSRRVDKAGTDAMFAVVTMAGDEIETPDGLREADPQIVGALAGSTF